MTRYEEGQLVEFKANENYWEGKPKLDGVELIYQKDTAVALEAYKAGQLDIVQPDPSQLDAINADATLSKEFVKYPGANTYGWGFNLTKEPFTDHKVVEAFGYAFDSKTYCEAIRKDCIPTTSWVPEDVAGGIKTDKYAFDPEKAKQVLAESKYGSADKLPEIKVSYNADDPATQPRMEWVAGQYRDILGINLVLDPLEGKTLTAMRKDPKTYPQACAFCNNWFQDYPDPQNWLSVYWTCDGFAKRVSYCNKKLDEILAQADVELDPAKRTKLYEQASEELMNNIPGPFLYHVANQFLVKPYVKGYKPTSADSEWPGQWGSELTIEISR
jgi:oligopeptide transport system substrate-binding protein